MIVYRRAHLIDSDTVYGWHAFTPRFDPGADLELWHCAGCHGYVLTEHLRDDSWRWRLGGRCRGFLRALMP